MFKKIADWLIETGLKTTTNGSCIIYFEEIADKFNVPVHWIKNNKAEIEDALDFDIVAECDTDDESFDMMFYLQYCCEHCDCYKNGNRSKAECSYCEIWLDEFEKNEKQNGVNNKHMKSNKELRIEKLEQAGINTDKFIVNINNMKAGTEIKIIIGADGKPQVISLDETEKIEDTVLAQIINDGYVRNTKLHRRFVLAQMMDALNYKDGFNAWLRNHGFNYQFKAMIDETKVLSKLESRDKDTFDERSHFFTKDVVVATCKNYVRTLDNELKLRKPKNCKGIPYIRVGGEEIFVKDIYKKLITPMNKAIEKINNSRNYTYLNEQLASFTKKYVQEYRVSENANFAKEFIDAYKGSGAFYSLKNMVQFHDCVINEYRGNRVLKGIEAVEYIQSLLDKYEGWQYMAMLKKCIDDNNFNLAESIEIHKKDKN